MNKIQLLIVLTILINQFGYSINPMKEYTMKPDLFKIEYEEVKIKTKDDYELNTWVMESSNEDKKGYTIVIVGSDAGNMGFSLPYASYLLKNGYDVITFDYRGFGDSSSFNYNPNNYYHEEYVEDFVTIIEWTKTKYERNKIGVLAFSMGTLISSIGYNEIKYDVLVGEGFIKSPAKTVKRVKKEKGKELNLPKSAKQDGKRINKIEIPILIFSSRTDKITTLKDSEQIASKRTNRKVVVFEGEHLRGGYTLGMPNYINEINQFIE